MNNNVEKNKDSKKIITLIILITVLMICETGATYAYFAISATNSSSTGTAATVGLTLAVSRVTPDSTKWNASTQVMVPQLNSALGTAMNTTNKCVDGNSNVICEVFKIDITNTSTAAVKLRGAVYFKLSNSTSTFSNLYWRKVTNANTIGSDTIFKASIAASNASATAIAAVEQADSSTANEINATLINPLSLAKTGASGASTTYYVVVWISETGESQNTTDKGAWTMYVTFKDSVNGNGVTSTITA